jgi:hypothetical protein
MIVTKSNDTGDMITYEDYTVVQGPFEVSQGPKARIQCPHCHDRIRLRNFGERGIVLLLCMKPACRTARTRR